MTESDRATNLLQRDFLEVAPAGTFDAVIMNPPFKMGRDIKHIMHALKFLTPGGLLISLCYDGSRQNKQLRPLCDRWNVLPSGTFKSEGTGASVVLLTIRKDLKR
jgi:16S rRNA G1207 methylase RsmC